MAYEYFIYDVDGTLLDFREAYCEAQRAVAEQLGVPCSPEFIQLDEALSWEGWRKFQLDRTDQEIVQQNYHAWYDQYLKVHFQRLCEEIGVKMDADQLVRCYQQALAASRKPVESVTLEVYSRLAKRVKNVVATNGIGWVQRARLHDFLPDTQDVFISEEMGIIKPAAKFYEILLSRLGCRPDRCLMIGDSLFNDIAGAKAAGIPACWYNRKKKPLPQGTAVDYVIEGIEELEALL